MEHNENLLPGAANYESHVGLKFQLYNSLFLTLPLDGIKNTGIFIPVLNDLKQKVHLLLLVLTVLVFVKELLDDLLRTVSLGQSIQTIFVQYRNENPCVLDAVEWKRQEERVVQLKFQSNMTLVVGCTWK